MRSLTIFLIFAAVFSVTFAGKLPQLEEDEGGHDSQLENIQAANNGCPIEYACHNYCKSVGRRGGYCEGFLRQNCHCYT